MTEDYVLGLLVTRLGREQWAIALLVPGTGGTLLVGLKHAVIWLLRSVSKTNFGQEWVCGRNET